MALGDPCHLRPVFLSKDERRAALALLGPSEVRRPALQEIEITPEMIEAGVAALENSLGVISPQGAIRAVYSAMVSCARCGSGAARKLVDTP